MKYDEYLRLENVRKEQATIPMAEIQKIADTIAANFKPDKIILFGSYAYGVPRRGSDVDMLVVMATEKNVLDVALEMRLALPMRSFGLDLIVRTPSEVERRLKMEDQFMMEITKLGKVLYERKNDGMDRESGN
ncbi:MAG: nucleotidyltransferase domain-containing protein [Chloroflexi bacterium]|nr:nucleotidyltransferase domain-containing protein [Chloroflexota bacterium]